ncbi:unnamed protein product, partial [Mesorhabditis spiculigera]
MVFSEITGTLSFLQPQPDDDIADRLHYYYTSTFLLLTAVLISLKMFGGRPIECWLPAEYKKSWEDYTEMYCWARSTYYTPFHEDLPEAEERGKKMVSYYQWVPFYFVVVAFTFYAPCLIWRIMYDKSGIRLKDIMSFANDKSNVQPGARQANIKGLSAHLASVFKHRFKFGTEHPFHHKIMRFFNFRYYEAYLTFLYIGIKFLYLLNVVSQMVLMDKFLQTESYGFYGWGVMWDLINGREWTESVNFPVITYCDMQIRILGNVQRHTVQCVLIINIFTEKIFILLWLWYTLLAMLTFGSIMSWIFTSIPLQERRKFIARRLELADVNFKKADFNVELDEFVNDYIKMDGIFVLRMVTIHSGILICTEVVDQMWDQFLEEQGHCILTELAEESGKHADHMDRERVPSAMSENPPLKRKTSVLVPLVSREDLTHLDHNFLRPPSRMRDLSPS